MEIVSLIVMLIGVIGTLIGTGLTARQYRRPRCNNRTHDSRIEKLQVANDALRKTLSIALEENRRLHGHIQALIERQGER